jgi:hypothetical protein
VGTVDPDDDSVWRWVIRHYRFDPDRNERRHVVVAAYDNEPEFEAAITVFADALNAEVTAGQASATEHITGVTMNPGHNAQQATARAVKQALRRGVDPRGLLALGTLPSSTWVVGVDDDGNRFSYGGGEPPEPPANLRAFRNDIP